MTVNSDRRRTALAAICTSRQCTFHLDVTLYKTMTYRDEYLMLRPVQLNGSQLQANVNGDIRNLSASEVILADGFPRDVILINGQFPGPTIEVTEGAQVCRPIFVPRLMFISLFVIQLHCACVSRAPGLIIFSLL